MIHIKQNRCGYNGYTCLGVEALKDPFTEGERTDVWTFKGITNTITNELDATTKSCIIKHACVSCATDFSPFTGTFFDFYNTCAASSDLKDTGILEPTTTDPTDILAPIDTNIGGYTSLTPEYQKVHLTVYKYIFDIDLSALSDLFGEEMDILEDQFEDLAGKLQNTENNYDYKFDTFEQRIENIEGKYNDFHQEFKTFKSDTNLKIENIEGKYNDFYQEFKTFEGDTNLKIENIELDITNIETDITNIETDITNIETDITTINNNIETINNFISNFKTEYKPTLDRLKSIKGVVKGNGDGTYEGLDTSTCEE